MRTLKRICITTLVFLLPFTCISGCRGRAQTEGEAQIRAKAKVQQEADLKKLHVVTTLFPYYDFTRQIAGDQVELMMVVPAGMDSHSFEPTPADIQTIQEADVLICNGGAMEHWVSQTLEALDTSEMTVITMMDYVDAVEEELVEGMEAAHGHGEDGHREDDHKEERHRDDPHEIEIEYDEHIWTSPKNAIKFTQVIGEALAEADPQNKAVYEAGLRAYIEKLEKVHQGFLKVSQDKKRNMIIVGDKFPFRYLADEYGFEYRAAFSGCSTDTEPSARTIAYLIDKVKEDEIPIVYYLELSSHRVSEIIGEETGADPLLLHSCHNVTRREFDSGITYVDLMMQNIENLRKGLDE